MEISGKVVEILQEQSGQGRIGTWRRLDFIIEVPGQFPKKVCIGLWGDKIDQAALKLGDEVTASIDIESREYNGKWFTSLKAWKVEKPQAATSSKNELYDIPQPDAPPPGIDDEDTGLPF